MGEDEYLRRGDWIKPFLDPAPNRREECRRSDNLLELEV